MSFRFRFFVTFIFLETLFMLAIVFLNFNALERESKKLMEEKTYIASNMFSEIVATPLLVSDLATLDDAANGFVAMEGMVQVRLLSLEGDMLSEAYSDVKGYDHDLILNQVEQLPGFQDAGEYSTFEVDESSYLIRKEKLKVEGSEIAFVQFVYDITRSVQALEKNAVFTWTLAAIEITISTIVALITGFNLARSVSNLSYVANEIAHDRPVEIPDYSRKGDEVQQLYQSMHTLQTNIKSREQELKKQSEKALAASKAKSEFLAAMSHELRTPINGMLGALNLIDRKKLPDGEIENIDTAKASSELLLAVVKDILDFSKIEAGKFRIKSEPISVQKLIHDVAHIYRPLCREKQLEFVVSAEAMDEIYIQGDEVRIKQILSNYLNNACKFTSAGKIELLVEQNTGGEISFTVSDTGIGIREEDMDKLFKDFSQIDGSSSRAFGGTGLGLVISDKLAKLMNGELSVSSSYGVGSSFSITLRPEFIDKVAYEASHAKPTDAKQDENTEMGIHILLVEDNLINQKVASRVLEKAGCEVTIAENGQLAVDLLEDDNHPFELVLMDCQMPVMDGYVATRELRSRGIGIPIIALTANALESDRKACMEAGMDDFVAKPFKPDHLFEVIRAQLLPQAA